MKGSRKKTGFTPTPTLMQFRFLDIYRAKFMTFVHTVFPMKNSGETKKQHQSWCRGFTLVEMIIYIAFFAILSVVAINATIMVMRSFYSLRITQSISQSATTAMERMSREIRSAYNINTANSTFDTSPGRLTVLTKDEIGTLLTVEFYVTAGNQINMKINGADQGSLMTKTVSVTNLIFRQITTTNTKAVKIEMTLTDNRSGITKTNKYYDTIVLRGSMH